MASISMGGTRMFLSIFFFRIFFHEFAQHLQNIYIFVSGGKISRHCWNRRPTNSKKSMGEWSRLTSTNMKI